MCKAERKEKFVSTVAELNIALESFAQVNTDFDSSLGEASLLDKRSVRVHRTEGTGNSGCRY